MLKAQEVLNKISENSNLMAEFKKTKSFEELYVLCKKIDSNLTEKDVKEGVRELITKNLKNNVSPLSNKELASVAGGSMDFNKTKALVLSALMLTGVSSMTMFSNNAYATGAPETTSISQKAQTENDEQRRLDQALLQAVLKGDKTLVEKLVNQGANINKSYYVNVDDESIYRNSLGLAAETGQIELVTFLLKKGADINKNAGSGTALEFAAGGGHLDIVKYLLDNGAKDVQEGALWSAVSNSQVNVIKFLLGQGSNANSKEFWLKYSVLMKAARKGNADIVKLLLDHGASVLAKDNEGKTAYDYASTDEVREILKEAAEKSGLFDKTISNIKYWTGLDRFF